MKKKIFLVLIGISGLLLVMYLFNYKFPITIPTNIEDNFFILAASIDKADNGEGIKVTIMSEKFGGASSNSESSSGSKQADIASSTGETTFDAIRKFSLFHNQKLFWGHIKYIIISEELAKENILDYLDFFIRDHELRFNTSILIAKNTPANEILKVGEETKEFVPDTIDSLLENANKISVSKEIRLVDIMQAYDNSFDDITLPSITIKEQQEDKEKSNENEQDGQNSKKSDSSDSKEENSGKKEDEKSQKDLFIDGYAVIRNSKSAGFIDGSLARGVNWVNNRVDSTDIIVEDDKNKKVTLEVISSSSKVEVKYDGDLPEIKIKLKLSTNVAEQMSSDNIFSEDQLNILTEKQQVVVKKEVEEIVKYCQENEVDILELGEAVYRKYPLKFEKIEDNWRETLKNVNISVDVESKISRTYHVRDSIAPNSKKDGDRK